MLKDHILIFHVLWLFKFGTTPFFHYQLFTVLRDIVIINLNQGLPRSIILCVHFHFFFLVKFCNISFHVRAFSFSHLSINKIFGDGGFQIWALKGWSLARLTSAINHLQCITIDVFKIMIYSQTDRRAITEILF